MTDEKSWAKHIKPYSLGGAVITEPLEYKGEIPPFYLEKVEIPRGELINAFEEYGRLCFQEARERMQAIDRTPWRTYDHFANSSQSHDFIEKIVGKKCKSDT